MGFFKRKLELVEVFVKVVKHSYLLRRNRKTGSQKDSVNYVASQGKLLSSEFLMCPGFVACTEVKRVFSSELTGHNLNVCASSVVKAKGCCYTAELNVCDVFQSVNQSSNLGVIQTTVELARWLLTQIKSYLLPFWKQKWDSGPFLLHFVSLSG